MNRKRPALPTLCMSPRAVTVSADFGPSSFECEKPSSNDPEREFVLLSDGPVSSKGKRDFIKQAGVADES